MRFIVTLLLVIASCSLMAQNERIPLIKGLMALRNEWFTDKGELFLAFSELQAEWRQLGMVDADFEAIFDDYWSYSLSFHTFQRKITKKWPAVGAQLVEEDYALFVESRYLIELIKEGVIAPKWPFKIINNDGIIEEVALFELHSGMRIAEIGAGTGLASIVIGSTYDSLELYVNELGKDIFHYLDGRIQQTQSILPTNTILPVAGQAKNCAIPAKDLDVVFMRDAYHHFLFKDQMLASIRLILAPGGRLLVSEQVKGFEAPYICPMAKEKHEIVERITANGFVLIKEIELSLGYYLFIFQLEGSQ